VEITELKKIKQFNCHSYLFQWSRKSRNLRKSRNSTATLISFNHRGNHGIKENQAIQLPLLSLSIVVEITEFKKIKQFNCHSYLFQWSRKSRNLRKSSNSTATSISFNHRGNQGISENQAIQRIHGNIFNCYFNLFQPSWKLRNLKK
jgi:hypothetical protein